MTTPAPYKICPRCQTRADVNAPQCLACGRPYKTRFAAPEVTQFVGAQPLPASTAPTGKIAAVVTVTGLVLVLLLGGFYFLQRGKTATPTTELARPTLVSPYQSTQPSAPTTPVYGRPQSDEDQKRDELRRQHTRLE